MPLEFSGQAGSNDITDFEGQKDHEAPRRIAGQSREGCSEGFLWLHWIVNSPSHIEVSCYLLVSLICSLALYAESSRRLVFCLLLYFETKLSKIYISLFYPDFGESRSEPFIFQFAVCKVIPHRDIVFRRAKLPNAESQSFIQNERTRKKNLIKKRWHFAFESDFCVCLFTVKNLVSNWPRLTSDSNLFCVILLGVRERKKGESTTYYAREEQFFYL